MVDFARNAPKHAGPGARGCGTQTGQGASAMGATFGNLEPRQLDRLRTELAEALAANVAYPSFFDYRTAKVRTRPVDQAKREEIEQYLRSVNFEPLARVDIISPELRRFFERLMLRYIEVNPALAQSRLARRLPELRSRVPRMAAEAHRGLLAFLAGEPAAATFGIRRQQPSWAETATTPSRSQVQPRPAGERNTRVLEAILVRQELGATDALAPLSVPAPTPSPAPPPASPVRQPAASTAAAATAGQPPAWLTGTVGSGDLTIPVPAQGWPASPGQSPFAGLESGAQSAVFGAIGNLDDAGAITERPTGPLPVAPGRSPASGAPAVEAAAHTPRELPPDLYRLYGDYLRDMEPEVEPPPISAPQAGPTVSVSVPSKSVSAAPAAPAVNGAHGYSAPMSAAPAPAGLAGETVRSDKLIFWQLRYQLEAYVRRAAQSYGVRGASDDPFSVLDALRRSGFVDEADLRIAEGILALTDRVTATSSATIDDYRQAFLLYLLYHRSHLGV